MRARRERVLRPHGVRDAHGERAPDGPGTTENRQGTFRGTGRAGAGREAGPPVPPDPAGCRGGATRVVQMAHGPTGPRAGRTITTRERMTCGR
ncbi:hypothetical protein GCM10010400_76220 [Streptomyces aculeolatus]